MPRCHQPINFAGESACLLSQRHVAQRICTGRNRRRIQIGTVSLAAQPFWPAVPSATWASSRSALTANMLEGIK